MLDLATRRLYLCVGQRDDMSSFLPAVLTGGVDVVQLREKVRPLTEQLQAARLMRSICHEFNVPFLVNDSPELALDAGADGVHVGQEDLSVTSCRQILGSEALVGLSTHSDDEFEAALYEDATYFSAGPLVETPTKLGRPGTGVGYALRSQAKTRAPVFVTGGVNASNVTDLVSAGLRHFVVVRALSEADHPLDAARALRRALDEALSTVTIEPT
ncbi:MAG: thiamine-phosphate pyrophosphorylase [Acidimicrobiaceae bacterium]|nr:thiamine-phosphate pyrophosphorylase [Acidimicrobiaceae bacterium]